MCRWRHRDPSWTSPSWAFPSLLRRRLAAAAGGCGSSALPANFRAPAGNLINILQQYDQTDESGVNTAVVVAPAGSYMVTFGSLGQVLGVNPDGSAIMTQINVNSTGNTTRPLVVEIAPGGGTKMCDPDPGVPLGDPRHC